MTSAPMAECSHNLLLAAKSGGVVGGDVVAAAAALGSRHVEDITTAEHLILLTFLCDETLDTLLLHNLLQSASLLHLSPCLCIAGSADHPHTRRSQS